MEIDRRMVGGAMTLTLMLSGVACGDDDPGSRTSNTSVTANIVETQIRQTERIGVVPGFIIFKDGDVVVRPVAGDDGRADCPGADFDLHEDATTFFYRKNGKIIKKGIDQITTVELTRQEHRVADAKTKLILRQCVTTEGPVVLEESGDGYCVPVGEPDPNSRRIAVGRPVEISEAESVKEKLC